LFPAGEGILICPLRRQDNGQNVRIKPASTCVYRKLKLGRSGGEVRQGRRVI
jgi:hypothetical protein